jgi:hypothetical protein
MIMRWISDVPSQIVKLAGPTPGGDPRVVFAIAYLTP